MGSERKSKEKKSKKRHSYSSGSEDEGNSKRLRTEEDGERRGGKSDKKEKRKDKKSNNHPKRHSEKEKKLKEKHKSKHHKSDRHSVSPLIQRYKASPSVSSTSPIRSQLKFGKITQHEVQQLSSDDYFSKNNEFATWLKEEKNVFFSDLSSESAHELFLDFAKAWNNQKLESRYYEGIASGPRTSHRWKIKV